MDLSLPSALRDDKRLHSEVSPTTPLSPMTAGEFRALLHEAVQEAVQEQLDPLCKRQDGIEQSINAKQSVADSLQSEVAIVRQELERVKESHSNLQERAITLECQSRRNNLRFAGIEEPSQHGEDLSDCEKKIRSFQVETLELDPETVEKIK